MKIRYQIASEDVAAFNLQHLNGLPAIKKRQLKSRVTLSVIYGLTALGLFIYEPGYWPFAWLLMFFAILWFIFYPKVWEQRLRKKILKALKDKQYGLYELDLGPDGIFAKNDKMEGFLSWQKIKKIVVTDNHIFMYLTEDDGIIISKAGLEDTFDWGKLCERVKMVRLIVCQLL